MKNRKLKIFIRVLIVLAILGLAGYTAYKMADNSYFVTTFYEVEDDKIENHTRIVLLTDLHLKEYGEDNCQLVDEIKRLNPDIIAMAGDMVDMDETDYTVVLTLCRQLVDVAPVYFSYGNHEKEVIRVKQTSTINVDLEKMGVHVLHNQYESAEFNGNRFVIGGFSANRGGENAENTQNFMKGYIPKEDFKLLLVHYPQLFYEGEYLYGEDIDMALCGHLHGGVVRIPFFGGLYHPVDGFFPKLTEGCTLVKDTWVVVSRGIGGSPRFNNPPELVVVDLY
jgi:predicted MPP superfamily phosphohydrolase